MSAREGARTVCSGSIGGARRIVLFIGRSAEKSKPEGLTRLQAGVKRSATPALMGEGNPNSEGVADHRQVVGEA